MGVLENWINERYLQPDMLHDIIESVHAKPDIKYCVLDDFFRRDMLDQMIARHPQLQFNERADRTASDGSWLPYDGAVKWASQEDIGADLFFASEWHRYLCMLVGTKVTQPGSTEVKLRYHKPNANGFWIHSDSVLRSLVAICYFNKGWRAMDGGLLQLWRVDEAHDPHVAVIDNVDPHTRLNFLNSLKRIRTGGPGGGFEDQKPHDLVLMDQVVPTYNRLFLCDLRSTPAYHSVTPSNGKIRYGFVQWLH